MLNCFFHFVSFILLLMFSSHYFIFFFFFFNDTATTEIYTFPYTTLFRAQRRHMGQAARSPGRHSRQDAGPVRPCTAVANPDPPNHHAPGSRGYLRHDRRPHFPRRAFPRPVFHHAPAAQLGTLPDAIEESVPLRLRHPPRRWPDRRLRSQRLQGDLESPEEVSLTRGTAAPGRSGKKTRQRKL